MNTRGLVWFDLSDCTIEKDARVSWKGRSSEIKPNPILFIGRTMT